MGAGVHAASRTGAGWRRVDMAGGGGGGGGVMTGNSRLQGEGEEGSMTCETQHSTAQHSTAQHSTA